MDAAFLKLIELSISGSLFVLAVVLLRLIFRKAPKWVFCLLWGMVALRLILPVSIESSFSLIPNNVSEKQIASQMAQSYVGDVTYIHEGAENYQAAVKAGRKPIQSGNTTYVVTQKDTLEEPQTVKTAVLPVLSRVWIAGVTVMLAYVLLSYLALHRKVSTATLLAKNIKQSECVDSPFVLGLLRPVIYLPYGIDDADRENVIAHEMAHIQRKDHWWKPIGFLILSVHWFNPVMWLAYILLCRDIEGACDEKVIQKLDMEGIRAYSTALLNCSVHRRSIGACPLAFGEVGVKERIKRVMCYKKPAFWIVLLALTASILASVLMLTSPKEDEQLLMGAYYRATELLYTNKQEGTQVYSRFCITADYRLMVQKQGQDSWLLNQKMERYPLTAEELRQITQYDNGWHSSYRITEIRDAYILPVENNYFYLAVKTKSGDTLLGFGGVDPTGNPGDYSLRYLYRLEPEFTPGEVDLDFIAQSLLPEAGIVNIIDVWESEENPGFMVAGLVSGYQYNAAGDYDDMGFAVFQTDGTGYRLLNCKMYENVLYKENSIFVCPDPVVLSLVGEFDAHATYDLILSCNEKLDKIQREYYRGDRLIHSIASVQMGSSSMHLFRWDAAPKADTVTQMFLDKDGKELPIKTTEETILELIDQIALNPAMAASSNPYDYIKAGQELFDQILSYGDVAVSCMVSHLRSTQNDGLREYIMAAACAEFTGVGKDKDAAPWFSGKSWLNLYDGGSNSTVIGTPEDETGSMQVDSLLGVDCVWVKIVAVEDHPNKYGAHRYSYRFYYHGDGKKYDTREQEQYLLEIHSCLEYRMEDFDDDGIVELFVHTDAEDMPYELYDLDGTQIVVEKFSLVPDVVMDYNLLLDADNYYLYEERWAWFFKDPATYVAEVAKQPKDQLYFICPSGIIPAYTDVDLIENAIERLQTLAKSEPTAYEKEIIYKLLTTIELTYTQRLSPELVDYQALFEKWDFPYEGSTEERNCYEQMSTLFDADPVGFLQGMASVDDTDFKKDIRQVATWLAKENFLYDAEAFTKVLGWLKESAADEREKDIAGWFSDEFAAPSLKADALLSGDSQQLWDAFCYDPTQVLYNLSSVKTEALKRLGQMLWADETPSQKLMDKGYRAVNNLLTTKPTGALKDVAYKFLLQLEWYGGYEDLFTEGQGFDYQRLFDKWTYSDGALATSCNNQMFKAFEADPKGFMIAITQWNQTAQEGRNMEIIAQHFAYQYQANVGYLETLHSLLTNPDTAEAAKLFIETSEKLTSE